MQVRSASAFYTGTHEGCPYDGLRTARGLKTQPHLEIDSAIGGARGEEPSGKGVGFSKDGRSEAAHRRRVIHIVEDVPRGNAEGEIEPSIGAHAAVKHTAGVAHAAQPSAAQAPSVMPAATAPGAPALHFLAEAEGFTEAQVGGELAEAGPVVGRDDGLARDGHGIKPSPGRADHVRGIREA
jgi:hypothetical protein